MATVAETISGITRKHLLENNGLLFGQCVTAVGWVGGTIPPLREEDGIVELPTSDVSNGGVVVGAGLAGRRPIYVIRYQGFMWYNLTTIVNYAAKSKEIWDVPCPIFVRALSMEGAIGPVASGSHHGLGMKLPGMPVIAPMTPEEWKLAWNYFETHDDPVLCSESRLSFGIDYEMEDRIVDNPEVTIFAISTGRLNSVQAAKQLDNCSLCHIIWLKPFEVNEKAIESLRKSKFGIVVDSEHETCGASQSISYELMLKTGVKVYAMGLKDRTAGFSPHVDNLTPSADEIIKEVKLYL
jgi:pyruvate/2-oxoglutarate/acetoin dehydrogenase E1 component